MEEIPKFLSAVSDRRQTPSNHPGSGFSRIGEEVAKV